MFEPKQNGRQFADDILKSFSWMKIYEFPLRFNMKIVPKSPNNNIPSPGRRQAIICIIWTNDG